MARKSKDTLLVELREHYDKGRQDNDTRQTRPNGWDDVVRQYHGVLPPNWPYLSEVRDPIVRTILQEKNARLFNGKLRGTIVPRENADIVRAMVHNAILDYQWDAANEGGAMIEKWAMMDMQARMFGASFGLSYWRTEKIGDQVVFEGNEFKVLDNRDVFVDYTANHVRNAKWVQVREFKTIDELEMENDGSPYPIYKNLKELKDRISSKDFQGDLRSNLYVSALKSIRNLEDRVGTDSVFPTLEVVTEYRKDRWITFVPRYGIIIRDIDNPYLHKRIPVVQLRYYPNGDDTYGDSEVEPILPLARSLDAMHSAFVDAINIAMNPPIKVANSHEVRMDTLVYGPNALWLIGSNPNNVSEHTSGDQAIASYRTAVPAIRMAIMNAMGESSQGLSSFDFKEADKTATEVMDQAKQRQSRDQQNQMYLTESLKDQMVLWLSNNQQFLFADPTKYYQVFRIAGRDMIKALQQAGMDAVDLPDESRAAIEELIMARNGDVDDAEMATMLEGTEAPQYPVMMNPNESNPMKMDIRTKLEMDETGASGLLYVTKEDMDPNIYFDYKPDVKSMAMGSVVQKTQERAKMLEIILNQQIQQQLAMEGKRLKVSEFVLSVMQSEGEPNPDKYLEDIPNGQQQINQGTGEGAKPIFTGDANLQAGGGLNPTNQTRRLVSSGGASGVPGAGAIS